MVIEHSIFKHYIIEKYIYEYKRKEAMNRPLILFVFLILVMPLALADLQDGLLAHYPLDNATLGNDSTGNYDSIASAGTTQTDGKIGEAAAFFGDADYYQLPEALRDATQGENDFTITGWLRRTGNEDNFFLSGWGTSNKGYYFATLNNGTIRAARDTTIIQTATTYSTGIWIHFAFTFDVSEDNLTIYINNIQEASSDQATQNLTATQGLYIGGIDTYMFDGSLDEISFYNRTLTTEEINESYGDGLGCDYECMNPTPATPTGAVVGAGDQATQYAIAFMAMFLLIGLMITVVPIKNMNPTVKKIVFGVAGGLLVVIILITIL